MILKNTTNNISGSIDRGFLQGLSAYEVAVKNGYTGTEEEWLASLKGEPYTESEEFETLSAQVRADAEQSSQNASAASVSEQNAYSSMQSAQKSSDNADQKYNGIIEIENTIQNQLVESTDMRDTTKQYMQNTEEYAAQAEEAAKNAATDAVNESKTQLSGYVNTTKDYRDEVAQKYIDINSVIDAAKKDIDYTITNAETDINNTISAAKTDIDSTISLAKSDIATSVQTASNASNAAAQSEINATNASASAKESENAAAQSASEAKQSADSISGKSDQIDQNTTDIASLNSSVDAIKKVYLYIQDGELFYGGDDV